MANQTRYLGAIERLFAAVDAGDNETIERIDSGEVDPLFDDIEHSVVTAAGSSRQTADRQLTRLKRLQTRVAIATPVVFLIGLGLVVFFWRVLRSVQAKAKRDAVQSEQRYRLLVQNSSDRVLICSTGGEITYESHTIGSGSALGGNGPMDEDFFSLIHPDDDTAARALMRQALNAPSIPRQSEMRVTDGAGGWRYAELILTNLLHEGAVAGIVVTIHDIDERKGLRATTDPPGLLRLAHRPAEPRAVPRPT